jgi:hypothetical protein
MNKEVYIDLEALDDRMQMAGLGDHNEDITINDVYVDTNRQE